MLAAFVGAASQLRAQSGSTVSIIPLGDSLTWGFDGNEANNTVAGLATYDDGGYRAPLEEALTSQGVTVNYVGVSTENGGLPQDGFNGYRIDQISANLDGYEDVYSTIDDYGGYWLTGGGGTGRGPETANIILLQIGANDLVQKYDPLYTGTGTETAAQLASDTATRLGNLINKIITLEPTAMLLVDGTPAMLNGAFYTDASEDYDADVQSLISSQFQGKDVDYVDMMDAILAGTTTSAGYTPGYALYEGDGVHLTTLGYDVMGQTWDTAILDDYDFSDPPDPVPEPSTYALFAGGALALFAWRRFRRAS